MSFFHPSQSSSASPSSMERIGHLAQSFFHRSIISSDEMIFFGSLLKKQYPVLPCFLAWSNSSVQAASRANWTWSPSLYPAFSTAVAIVCRASSAVAMFGANPPSSPTDVERPLSWRTFFKLWNTSAPIRRPSRKEGAPTGMTMNSWKSIVLSAWAPPLTMFIIGTGSTLALVPPR